MCSKESSPAGFLMRCLRGVEPKKPPESNRRLLRATRGWSPRRHQSGVTESLSLCSDTLNVSPDGRVEALSVFRDWDGSTDARQEHAPGGRQTASAGPAAGSQDGVPQPLPAAVSGWDPRPAALFPATRECAGALVVYQAEDCELDDLRARALARRGPSPVPRGARDSALVESWADWLQQYFPGEPMNLTGTYSDAYGYPHGLMLARNVMKDFRAFCRDMGCLSESACIGVEHHPSGRDVLHFHAVLGGHWTKADCARLQFEWTRTRGWAVAKPVSDRGGCVEYAAKHLLKQRSDSDHFEFFPAPRIYASRREWRIAKHGHQPRCGQAVGLQGATSESSLATGCP